MRGRGFASLIGGVLASAVTASPAFAGSYDVSACMADERGANLSWASSSSSVDLPSYSGGCSGATADGLVARAAARPTGGSVPAFGAASWQFDAPAGTTIGHADLSLRLYRYGGGQTDRWGVGIGDETGAYLLGGIGQSALASGSRGSYFALTVANRTSLRLGVVCANGGGCSVQATDVAGAGYSRARTDLYGARVRINDPTTVVLSAKAGALWTSSAWLSGRQPLSFTATDNVGVASLGASVGAERRVVDSSCDYARAAPCPDSRNFAASFDTAELADGAHTVTISAEDSGGNESSDGRQVLVDNTPPGAPGPPQLSGAPPPTWRTVNDFTLSYTNPSKAGGAPLNSRDVQICAATADGAIDPGDCSVEGRSGAPGIDAITVPRVGRFKMRVRVNDELFKGQWSVWSPLLLFDDSAAGTPIVRFPAGWVNRERIATPLTIEPPSQIARPPSGYAAYRITVDGGPPITVAASGSGQAGSFAIATLTDGRRDLNIVAVTGAGLVTPALLAARGAVEKDVVPPILVVSGAPAHGAFVTTEVTFAMHATDVTSGMAAAVPPAPVAAGGYVATLVDRAGAKFAGGAQAQISPGEGEHLVQSYAVDVAGNPSAVQSFAYTQDTEPPSGGLRPIRADHPALLDFFIDERCVGRASIEISTAPGAWSPLRTSESFQRASALVPAEVWEPRTPYTVRAVVSDCAGNSAILTDWYGGSRSGTPIGTITPPPRAVVVAKAQVAPLPHSGGASAAATRRVTVFVRDRSGDALADLPVRFETEPWMTPSRWEPVGSSRTDAKGRATASATAHHSLRIRAVIPGSELRDQAVSNVVYATRLAATTITVSRRTVRAGHGTTVRGRMRGGLIPRGGFEIVLYGRGPRSRGWVPIRTDVDVSGGGYWSSAYRFLHSSHGSFQFRVRPPNRPDYPFRSAFSPSVRVRVR